MLDSPRAKREREPAPLPGEDPRMQPFDEWLAGYLAGGNETIEAKSLENLRASFAIVAKVKPCKSPARFAQAVHVVTSYGCPVPEGLSSAAA